MGFFSNIFSKLSAKKQNKHYIDMMNGYAPVFSQFGTNIYANDIVQQCVNCISAEMKKLSPEHIIRSTNGDTEPSKSNSIQPVLNEPNELMTTSDFLEKATNLLLLNLNAFIVPVWREKSDRGVTTRTLEALYPIQPTQVDFIQDNSNALFIHFYFANGTDYILKHSDVIHWKMRYATNDFMGGDLNGQPDNSALLTTLDVYHTLLQGVSKAMKASYAINGIVKYNGMLDDGKTEKALKELETKLKNAESGFLPLDLKSEFVPIKKETKLVDADTLKFVDDKILRHYGVSLPIITADYTAEQYEAFYQKTLEPLIISLGQAFTKVLFTKREKGFNNEVVFYANKLEFMTKSQILEMIRLLGDHGSLFENEARTALGLRPLAELKGVRMQSLNYVNVNDARKYQVGDENSNE